MESEDGLWFWSDPYPYNAIPITWAQNFHTRYFCTQADVLYAIWHSDWGGKDLWVRLTQHPHPIQEWVRGAIVDEMPFI